MLLSDDFLQYIFYSTRNYKYEQFSKFVHKTERLGTCSINPFVQVGAKQITWNGPKTARNNAFATRRTTKDRHVITVRSSIIYAENFRFTLQISIADVSEFYECDMSMILLIHYSLANFISSDGTVIKVLSFSTKWVKEDGEL